MCYWEYVPPKPEDRRDPARLWKLAESFRIDQDGYPMDKTSTGDCSDGRHEWTCWMYTDNPDDGYDDDRRPIMGRAVTLWTVESGVSLMNLHPPEWVPWLSISFIEELKKLKNWYAFLQCGYNLHDGTARAAEKIIYGE